MRIISLIAIIFLSLSTSEAQRGRKFTPIYGQDADANRTIAFISDNIIFDSLTYSRLSTLSGYVRCGFNVDPSGKVVNVKIHKGLTAWIDYEIMLAMNTLPLMQPFSDKTGRGMLVKREIYFTFNSDDEHGFKSPYDMPDALAQSIDKQSKERYDKMAKADKKWDEYVKDNTKLSLDGKGIYKPGILPHNPLKNQPPPVRPPLSVTIRAE